ncbi:MAG: hypothetical protein ACLQUY_02295 [Ktedonobacterales bacterium]
MVTTLGDLRHENKVRASTMSMQTPRKPTLTRPDDADLRLPHEVVGLFVAQALDWDTTRIVEAFTIALKQASGQGQRTRIDGSEAKVDPSSDPTGKQAQNVPAPEQEQLAPGGAPDGGQAPTDSPDRLAAQDFLTEQFAQSHDEGHTPAIAEVRQQFITLGELVLEAIGAVDRSGGEAVS